MMGVEAILSYCAGLLFIASFVALSKSIRKPFAARDGYEEAERCLREARKELRETQATYGMLNRAIKDGLYRSVVKGEHDGEV